MPRFPPAVTPALMARPMPALSRRACSPGCRRPARNPCRKPGTPPEGRHPSGVSAMALLASEEKVRMPRERGVLPRSGGAFTTASSCFFTGSFEPAMAPCACLLRRMGKVASPLLMNRAPHPVRISLKAKRPHAARHVPVLLPAAHPPDSAGAQAQDRAPTETSERTRCRTLPARPPARREGRGRQDGQALHRCPSAGEALAAGARRRPRRPALSRSPSPARGVD